MLTNIESVVLFVPDIAAAARWYAEIVNASVEYENDRYAFIRAGRQLIGFHPADAKCPGGVGGTTVYWEVTDLNHAVSMLVGKGAALHRGPRVTVFGARVAMLVDPFGCTIGLNESVGPNSSEQIEIRDARSSDDLTLSVLAMQVFLDTYATDGIRPVLAREVTSTYSQAQFTTALSDPAVRILVAAHDDHLIGFAQLTLGAMHELAPGGPQTELLRLYVQEPYTARGVGTRLLAAAEASALTHGSTVLWLTPWVHNHRAIAFYVRRKYEDYGLTYFRMEGEEHENRLLAKTLGNA